MACLRTQEGELAISPSLLSHSFPLTESGQPWEVGGQEEYIHPIKTRGCGLNLSAAQWQMGIQEGLAQPPEGSLQQVLPGDSLARHKWVPP